MSLSTLFLVCDSIDTRISQRYFEKWSIPRKLPSTCWCTYIYSGDVFSYLTYSRLTSRKIKDAIVRAISNSSHRIPVIG